MNYHSVMLSCLNVRIYINQDFARFNNHHTPSELPNNPQTEHSFIQQFKLEIKIKIKISNFPVHFFVSPKNILKLWAVLSHTFAVEKWKSVGSETWPINQLKNLYVCSVAEQMDGRS